LAFRLGVLSDSNESLAPSSPRTLARFEAIAADQGITTKHITLGANDEMDDIDALFIRSTTVLGGPTHDIARRAASLGIPVIDDPASIEICSDKARLAEVLANGGARTPRTIVSRSLSSVRLAAALLGYPVVLKELDSAFSRGVKKADDDKMLIPIAEAMLQKYDRVVVQEFMPTEFDWRVATLDGNALFVCKYYMASGHWQIVDYGHAGKPRMGGSELVAVPETPPAVLEAAVRAANLVGRGLYGVDLKVTPRGVFVIEVNDNPSIDLGVEDDGQDDHTWCVILDWFATRVARARSGQRESNGPTRPTGM
jgi:glutathione synthase/RimK-type ligase-like ATP-grasp enzyme